MLARSGLIVGSWVLALACNQPSRVPPPQQPAAAAPTEPARAPPEPPTPPDGEPDDVLDELRGQPETEQAPARPEPFEVIVDATMTKENAEATVIMVGANPVFAIHMEIDSVEPPTPLLEPGSYTVVIHSPSKTFRGPVPGKGKRVRFKMSIYPEDPADPHDEVFFASLWID